MRQMTPELRAAQANLSGRKPAPPKPDVWHERVVPDSKARLRELDRERKLAYGRRIVEEYEPAQREFDRLMRLQSKRQLSQQEHGEAEEWQSIMDQFHEKHGPAWGKEYDSAKRAYKKQVRSAVVRLEALGVVRRGIRP